MFKLSTFLNYHKTYLFLALKKKEKLNASLNRDPTKGTQAFKKGIDDPVETAQMSVKKLMDPPTSFTLGTLRK